MIYIYIYLIDITQHIEHSMTQFPGKKVALVTSTLTLEFECMALKVFHYSRKVINTRS